MFWQVRVSDPFCWTLRENLRAICICVAGVPEESGGRWNWISGQMVRRGGLGTVHILRNTIWSLMHFFLCIYKISIMRRYRTRISYWVSEWVTLLNRLDWCDPGEWRYLLKILLMRLWQLMILLETMLEVVIGVMVMEVDKVADEVTGMEFV